MTGFFRKYFNFLLTGSLSFVFAACYGPPMRLENPKAIKVKDSDNNVIPGLKVIIFENKNEIDQALSDENGVTEFFFEQKAGVTYTAVIEDIDGADNLGDFKTKELNLGLDSFTETNLEKK